MGDIKLIYDFFDEEFVTKLPNQYNVVHIKRFDKEFLDKENLKKLMDENKAAIALNFGSYPEARSNFVMVFGNTGAAHIDINLGVYEQSGTEMQTIAFHKKAYLVHTGLLEKQRTQFYRAYRECFADIMPQLKIPTANIIAEPSAPNISNVNIDAI